MARQEATAYKSRWSLQAASNRDSRDGVERSDTRRNGYQQASRPTRSTVRPISAGGLLPYAQVAARMQHSLREQSTRRALRHYLLALGR
ncbi:hypothetical protein [Pseudomonas sp.]|uniref:hypothetical protein n=1 Tax=Pseudomonas sp. TaxID=306 RepID=UPI00273518D6|nr:hypothetical protein [Pseudomonas sp.]MDP2746678.1 hypothetical protein [Pseudomonas sp.]